MAARGGRRKTLGIAAGLSRGAGRAGLDVHELTARRRERSVSEARETEGKRSRWPFEALGWVGWSWEAQRGSLPASTSISSRFSSDRNLEENKEMGRQGI